MARCIRGWFVLAVAAVATIAAVLAWTVEYKNPTPPRYYASLLSISRMDSKLEFNTSVGVESRSPVWGRACLERGMDVVVAYHGVPLAVAATSAEVCAGRWKLWSVQRTTVVARGSKVGAGDLPMVEGLLADALRRAGEFDVTFRVQSDRDHDGKLVTCAVRPFMDNGATACDVHYS